MPPMHREHIVRDTGTFDQPGQVHKTYEHTLRALIEAMEDARFRSYSGPQQP